ncbi:MAG: hypothetical protein Q4D62_11855 [Planctomycetia bacterium]|nr:hypothetical protein [Planctomycetia bacterium]
MNIEIPDNVRNIRLDITGARVTVTFEMGEDAAPLIPPDVAFDKVPDNVPDNVLTTAVPAPSTKTIPDAPADESLEERKRRLNRERQQRYENVTPALRSVTKALRNVTKALRGVTRILFV